MSTPAPPRCTCGRVFLWTSVAEGLGIFLAVTVRGIAAADRERCLGAALGAWRLRVMPNVGARGTRSVRSSNLIYSRFGTVVRAGMAPAPGVLPASGQALMICL